MECPKCGSPVSPGEPGSKAGLYHQGVRVPDNSLLYKAFVRLSRLPETEAAKVVSFLDLFYPGDGATDALSRMQRQIDRLEQRLSSGVAHAPSEPAAETAEPLKKKGPKKRGSRKADAETAAAVAELFPVETVEERQARMAKMEKDDRMKELALKKKREKLAVKEAVSEAPAEALPEADSEANAEVKAEVPHKKRPRRRRRRAKGAGGGSIPADASLPA